MNEELDARAAATREEYLRDTSKPAPVVVKPKSNVRTREQDEFMTPEKKARETKRQCRARVSLPSRDSKTLVSFECTEPANHVDGPVDHTESGRVRLRNNRVYQYDFTWSEILSEEVWRIEGSKEGDAQ